MWRVRAKGEDMETTVKVNLKDNSYAIIIGSALSRLGTELQTLDIGRDAVVVTHPILKRLYGRALGKSLAAAGLSVRFFTVPEGETSKSAPVFFKLVEAIARYSARRGIFIVAFGGGVIGDLTGYVAAAYKRGVPYVQVPTTLLAQIDSAIGGKVAIDLPVGKNLVGAFYQPRLVFSDVTLLSTLDKRQIRNGLSEAVKYGVIADKKLFDYIAGHVAKLLILDPDTLAHVVLSCSRIKARVVEQDEKETKGIRSILNFGHTVGHAVEAAGLFKRYHHGEAVALGMRAASELSVRLGLFAAQDAARVGDVLSEIGLPERIDGIRLPDILKHMAHDKKFKDGQTRFVLATGIGSVKIVDGIPLKTITQAIKAFI